MKMALTHLSGSLKGRTQYFNTDSIRFGIGGDCGIVFDSERDHPVCPFHAEITTEDRTPTIRDCSGGNGLFVNGRRIGETPLKDGDLIQFGDGGPLVRFRLSLDGEAAGKPWRAMVADSRDIVVRTPHPRPLAPLYLARHLCSDILRYGSPALRLTTVLLLVIPLAVITALGLALYHQRTTIAVSDQRTADLLRRLDTGRLTREEMERRLEAEQRAVESLRREQEELRQQLATSLRERDAGRASEQELQALRRQLGRLTDAQRSAVDIVARFERGVALLQGGYGFTEKRTGRPLRYQGLDALGNPYADKSGNPLVTVEGEAPPVVIYYAGTAFFVDRQGTLLTNRHLVRMWETFPPAQEAMAAGFEPDLRLLRLFVPGAAEPYALTVVQVSDRTDLAVLRADRPPPDLVPLSLADEAPRAGESIVMLSYPGSFQTLLALMPGPISQDIVREAGGNPVALAEAVAKRKLVRPLTTQGHVATVSGDSLAYEAGSATGSSGGPIFNAAGQVIAVNHAALPRVGGVHIGLPIRLAQDALAAAGRAAAGEPKGRRP